VTFLPVVQGMSTLCLVFVVIREQTQHFKILATMHPERSVLSGILLALFGSSQF